MLRPDRDVERLKVGTGTTTNVQLVEPDVVGSASRSIVIVPVQTPSRKDREPDGPVGVGSRPHAESPNRRNAAVAWYCARRVMAKPWSANS